MSLDKIRVRLVMGVSAHKVESRKQNGIDALLMQKDVHQVGGYQFSESHNLFLCIIGILLSDYTAHLIEKASDD